MFYFFVLFQLLVRSLCGPFRGGDPSSPCTMHTMIPSPERQQCPTHLARLGNRLSSRPIPSLQLWYAWAGSARLCCVQASCAHSRWRVPSLESRPEASLVTAPSSLPAYGSSAAPSPLCPTRQTCQRCWARRTTMMTITVAAVMMKGVVGRATAARRGTRMA